MAIEVDLIVEAITKGFNKLGKDISGVNRGLEEQEDKARKGGMGWTELKSQIDLGIGALRTAGQVAGEVYRFIGEGAELELARSQFDNLTATIGTTSDALLNELRTATSGMVSDAELISSATDIINLGLGSTQEETVRLAKAVSTLGLDMQQVILTFANNSKARLDALGLSVEGVTTRAAELEAQGFQGDAFDEAVLEGLEDKMALLGDASETTAGQMRQLESDWQNLVDRFKLGIAEIAGPAIGSFADFKSAQEGITEAVQNNIITQHEGRRLSSQLRRDVIDETELNNILEQAYIDSGQALKDRRREVELAERAEMELAHAMEEERAANADTIAGFEDAAGAASEYGTSLEELNRIGREASQVQREQAEAISATQLGFLETGNSLGFYEETVTGLYPSQDQLNQAIYDSAAAAGASNEQLVILGGALGLYSDEAVEAALKSALIQAKIDELTASYLEGDLSVQGMRTELGEFIATLESVPDVVATDVSVSGIDRARGQVDSLLGALNRLSGAGAGGPSVGGGAPAAAFQHGVSDFIVPAGFPNDSFIMGVSSGERVNVETASQQRGGGRGIVINMPITQQPGESGLMFAQRASDRLLSELKGVGIV